MTRLDIYSILLLISIGQILILILILLNQAKRNRNLIFLIAVLVIFFLNIMEPVFIHTRFLLSVPHLLYIGPSFLLLLGPALFLYAIGIKNKSFKWKSVYFLHIAPFIIFKLLNFSIFLQSAEEKVEIINHFLEYENSKAPYFSDFTFMDILFQFHPIFYGILAGIIIIMEQKRVRAKYNYFHVLFVTTLTIIFIFYLFGRQFLSLFGVFSYSIYWNLLAILMIGFTAFISYLIINKLLEPVNHSISLKEHKEANKIFKVLKESMSRDQIFLDPKISLFSLSNKLDVSPKILSKIINEFEQMNFSEFINSYRVEMAKTLIQDPKMQLYTLEAIAEKVGFSNKMTFNRAFKKKVLLTPSEYKSSVKK